MKNGENPFDIVTSICMCTWYLDGNFSLHNYAWLSLSNIIVLIQEEQSKL